VFWRPAAEGDDGEMARHRVLFREGGPEDQDAAAPADGPLLVREECLLAGELFWSLPDEIPADSPLQQAPGAVARDLARLFEGVSSITGFGHYQRLLGPRGWPLAEARERLRGPRGELSKEASPVADRWAADGWRPLLTFESNADTEDVWAFDVSLVLAIRDADLRAGRLERALLLEVKQG